MICNKHVFTHAVFYFIVTNRSLTCNLNHNILVLYSVLVQVRFVTSKTTLISSITNLVYELPRELPNDLNLRKLRNIRKISNLVEDVVPIPQETRNSRYQTFLALANVTAFSYPAPNTFPGIVDASF